MSNNWKAPSDIRRTLDDAIDVFERRTYLGMSHISDCPRAQYRAVTQGTKAPGLSSKRYCHEGLLHEADIVARLNDAGLTVYDQQLEIIAPFDPRFVGHIDGRLEDGSLIEVKSVSDTERLEQIKRDGARYAHRWQVQAYMAYGVFDLAYLIYKARINGALWVLPIVPEPSIQRRIEEKAKRILAAVDNKAAIPNCTCGRCPRLVRDSSLLHRGDLVRTRRA